MFSIYRTEEAQAPLREVWLEGDDALRHSILHASQAVDLQLCENPQEQGESREGTLRVLFEAPLGVLFEVDQEKQLVRVLRSWAFRTVADRDGWHG